MPLVPCDAVDLYYEEVGTGPVLLWIPGTGLRGRTWEQQVAAFGDRFRCISVDLRGSGESTGADTTFSVADLAADVEQLLDVLGVVRATVIGLSLGSAVAQELALLRPELVAGLVLLATWSSSSAEHHLRRHFESRLYALENGPVDVYAQFAFWMSSPWLYDHQPGLQADVEHRLREHMSTSLSGTAGHFRADLSHETRERLPGVDCPCLVVHGDDDLITLPWYNATVAELIPRARLVTIPHAGHLCWLERPQELTAHIADFLRAFLPDAR
jgi:pimeloyl-ACP methyl ester carboxylesterase